MHQWSPTCASSPAPKVTPTERKYGDGKPMVVVPEPDTQPLADRPSATLTFSVALSSSPIPAVAASNAKCPFCKETPTVVSRLGVIAPLSLAKFLKEDGSTSSIATSSGCPAIAARTSRTGFSVSSGVEMSRLTPALSSLKPSGGPRLYPTPPPTLPSISVPKAVKPVSPVIPPVPEWEIALTSASIVNCVSFRPSSLPPKYGIQPGNVILASLIGDFGY